MAKRRGNNEGSIFKLPNGHWRAQVSVGGQRLSKSFPNQRDARDWLRATQEQVEDGLTIDGAKTNLEDYFLRWLEIVKPLIHVRTWQQYERIGRLHILPTLGKVKLKDLRPDQIQGLYTAKLHAGTGPRTVQLIHVVLHRSLNQALKWSLVRRNPCDAVDRPRLRRSEMKALNVSQAKALLSAATGDRLEALFYLALNTGLREGKLLGLRWSDLDWKTGALHVQRQLQWISGQGLRSQSQRRRRAAA